MANGDELLLGCRQWMQAALEELTLCPTAHTRPSLREGDELLKRIDAALRSGIALAPKDERELSELRERRESSRAYHRLAAAQGDPLQLKIAERDQALTQHERRLHELEAALVAVGAAFSSLDALVGAAKAIEEGRRMK